MNIESRQLTFDGDRQSADARRDVVVVYSDGGARGNPGPAAIGAVVLDRSTDPPATLASVSRRIGVTTNNVAEYEALIAGLEAARPFHARTVRVRADSQLLIRQLEGRYKVKHAGLQPLYARARALLADYDHVDLMHVPREENTVADGLVNAALDASDGAPGTDGS
jgi:ribonuclease HI